MFEPYTRLTSASQLAEFAAHAPAGGEVVDVGGDERQESVRIDLRHVARVVEDARERGRVGVAILITGPAVEAPVVAERNARIDVAGDVAHVGIAVTRRDGRSRHAVVEVAAAGGIAIAIFGRQGEEPFAAERQAHPARSRGRRAVILVARAAFGVDVGVVPAIGEGRVAAFARLAQAQVDHARDRIRTVLRGGAVAQHFDRLDGGQRDRVQIDGGRAAADGAVDVHQRRGMPALAVDEYQRLVGREAAQGRRADVIRAIGDGRPGEIERRRGAGQSLGEFGRGGRLQGGARQYVDRRQRIEPRAADGAGARDDHLVDVLIGSGGILRTDRRAGENTERARDGGLQRRLANPEVFVHQLSFLREKVSALESVASTGRIRCREVFQIGQYCRGQ